MIQNLTSSIADVVQQTVLMMLGVDADVKEPGDTPKRATHFQVSGIVGVTGSIKGNIVINLPIDVARVMTGLINREELGQCTERDVTDCVGELTNIVAGNLMALAADVGHANDTRISIPSVVIGAHRVAWRQRDDASHRVEFCTKLGQFSAEVNLRKAVGQVVGERDAQDFSRR